MYHHTRVFIDLAVFEANLRLLSSLLPPGCRLCAVVKADAYGHGLAQVAPLAIRAGASYLAIAENWEARIVREMEIEVPILRLRPATADEVDEGLAWRIEEVVGSLAAAQRLSQVGERRQQRIPVHLSLDVGISRMCFPFPYSKEEIERVLEMPGIEVVGVMAHYPGADEEDVAQTEQQITQFEQGTEALFGERRLLFHTANSAAGLAYPRSTMQMVRFGIACYGYAPSEAIRLPEGIRPVMTWKSTIVEIRRVPAGSTIGYGRTCLLREARQIATLPIGYADGYLRAFSNQASVLVHGVRCPVVGRVSMDMVTVDISEAGAVAVGEETILLGQQGQEVITAEELARLAQTIHYEILCLAGQCNTREWLAAP